MSTYKVIQDIESEDKLLGPFTLRQFVYAAIVVVMGFIAYKLSAVSPFFIIPFVLPMGFFGLLAAPFGHDQSSEVWLLAKIGFMLKPRRRIWDQTGLKELVTITVPQKIEHRLTNGLTQTEVKSRLQALASTIDSRGWAVKNVAMSPFGASMYGDDSDRLVGGSVFTSAAQGVDEFAADDMLDTHNNSTAQHLDTMINQSTQTHHQTIVSAVQNGGQPTSTPPADYWFMNQPSTAGLPKDQAVFDGSKTILPGTTPATSTTPDPIDQQLLEHVHKERRSKQAIVGHDRVLDPASGKLHTSKGAKPATDTKHPASSHKQPESQESESPSSSSNKAVVARLAANDDLNVATIAREADKAAKDFPDGEVVISLR